jgi:hypothetical protein
MTWETRTKETHRRFAFGLITPPLSKKKEKKRKRKKKEEKEKIARQRHASEAQTTVQRGNVV